MDCFHKNCGRGRSIITAESVTTVETKVLELTAICFTKVYNSIESYKCVADF